MHKSHIPIRTCLVCGKKLSKVNLLRLALTPEERTIVVDCGQRMEGRGAYVCQGCLPRLHFTRRVQKAFRNKSTGLRALTDH